MQNKDSDTLLDFWPKYVKEHSNLQTRQLHFAGNINLLLWLAISVLKGDWRLVIVAIVSSYGFAWIGHFLIEKNKPATFDYPLLAGVCNLVMFVQQIRGVMNTEVERYTSEAKS